MGDPNQITFFATTNSRGQSVPFGIKRRDRARHMYVIGKTGMGKSTLLENMAIQDIRNGEGMAFIDPHGSTADRLLEYVPAHRMRDVVYFAPFDMDYPIAFNVMEDVGYDKRHLVVSGLMSAFKKIWEDAWSARMEYILSNTLLALLEYPGSTLLDVNRMLVGTFSKKGSGIEGVTDKNAFRYKVVSNIKDPQVKNFWVDEFYGYTERYIQEATPAIQNKVGQFTSNPLIRNIVGQPKSSFDIRKLMDEQKILIINLSKGRVGESNAALLGSMLVTKIYLAAMSRADVPLSVMNGLPDFYFYVDEFQNFANESFSDILSEARKYKLNLLIAHQYVEQMEEEVRDAVFGNVGTTIAFRVGPFDAEALEKIFEPQFTATDLVNLGFAQVYLTLMIDGVGSPPFSATTLPPWGDPPERFTEQVIQYSRMSFGAPRVRVEKEIDEWQKLDLVAFEPQKQKREFRPATGADRKPAAPRPKSIYESGPAPYNPDPAPSTASDSAPAARGGTIGENSHPAPRIGQHHTPAHPSAELKRQVETLHRAATHAPERQEEPKREPRHETRAPKHSVAPQQPARPSLDGAKSLREALAIATGERKREEPRQGGPGGVHAPDLKDMLKKVAPAATADSKPAAKPHHEPAPRREHATKQKPELSPEELRSMLAVEPFDES